MRSHVECRRKMKWLRQRRADPVLCEEYIDGKDVYVAVYRDVRSPAVLHPRELHIGSKSSAAPSFATSRVKTDAKYRKAHRISYPQALLDTRVRTKLERICRRLFAAFGLRNYARFDFRISPDNKIYFLEANANPDPGPKSIGKVAS